MRFVASLIMVVGVGVAALAGCGGSNAAGDGGLNGDGGLDADGSVPLTPEDQAFITDFCNAVKPCCTANGLTPNPAVCQQSIAKVGMSRDPELRSACLNELHQLAALPACMPDIADFADPCARIFDEPSGPRAPGERCATAAECAGSPGTVTMCIDTCISYTAGAAGDYPCLGNESSEGFINAIPWKNGSTTPETHGFICQERARVYCDWNDNRCKPILSGGAACTTAHDCDSAFCGDGFTCTPLPGVGEACNSLGCTADAYCDDTGMCIARLAPGAACVTADQCHGDCDGSPSCSGSCENGVCSPLTIAQSFLQAVWCGSTPVTD